jgi:hypothetical protein
MPAKLIDCYVDTLGFGVVARYGDGDRVDHAQLNWPEGSGGIMVGSHCEPSKSYSANFSSDTRWR